MKTNNSFGARTNNHTTNQKMGILQAIKRFFAHKYKVTEVFTPATAATVNYLKREKIDSQLLSEMQTPGKQIIVFGHSGGGKTTSVRNMLNKNGYHFVNTLCESNTTFNQLLLNAFDELNVFAANSIVHKQQSSLSAKFESDFNAIKSSLKEQVTKENSQTYTRVLPVQLTPQKLAYFMGELKVVWVIEDFHKVPNEEKRRIADVLKIFVDNANVYSLSKVICLGACESAYELIDLNPNLKTRVSEISVPLLTDEEIQQIIENGFDMLNVQLSPSLLEKLVYYADKIGADAHQMCLDICNGEKITQTVRRTRYLDDDSFNHAITGFLEKNNDTFQTVYDIVTKNGLGWYVLKTFSNNSMGKLSFQMICKKVNEKNRNFKEDDIKQKLEELMSAKYHVIDYDIKTDTYTLSSPFWHRFLLLQFNIERANQQRKYRNQRNRNLDLNKYGGKYQMVDKRMQELIKVLQDIIPQKY